MFSQYFGNYLLNKGLIQPNQLAEALDYQDEVRLKLGVLAVNAGYMSAAQVSEVHQMQTKVDKKFGELAIGLGYLSEAQLEALLATQKQGHLLLGQALIDKDYLSLEQLQEALTDYKKEHNLSEEQFMRLQQGNVDEIINTFVKLDDLPNTSMYLDYISLMLRNVIRFIDNNPRVETGFKADEHKTEWLVWQEINGPFSLFTAIAADEQVFLELAQNYAGEEISAIDELAQASVAEFLNLHNGIFLVNMSNQGVELEMKPQQVVNKRTLTGCTVYAVPFYLRSGRFDLLVAESVPNL